MKTLNFSPEFPEIVNFLDQEIMTTYVNYISYKVQRALYEVSKVDDIPWLEFVDMICHSKELRTASRAVVKYTFDRYSENQFEFCQNAKTLKMLQTETPNTLYCAELYKGDKAEKLIFSFMLKVELAFFEKLREEKPSYTWEQYLYDLMRNKKMLRTLAVEFQRSIVKMDFAANWLCDEIEELNIFKKGHEQELEQAFEADETDPPDVLQP